MPFGEQFCVGVRDGVLKELISNYKYNSIRAASYELAELLCGVIEPYFTLVPLPTIGRHIRERGFDHIGLICKKMGMPVEKVLLRAKNTVQVGASSEQRREQAKDAYCARDVDEVKRYLLIDDVWTTGSSMMAACEAMRLSGAKNLAIAVIARSL